MDRASRVLVGYATAGGSTQSIAELIADVLRDPGLTVVCRPVGPDLEPGAFDAVVVGSAVHGMAWLRPAVDFLSRLPAGEAPSLWCFSVGGLPHPERTRFSRWLARSELQKIEQRLPGGRRPRDHRMFAGIVDLRQVPLWGRSSSGRPGDGPVTSGTGRPSRRGRARSRTGSTHSARLPEAIRHDPVGRSPARALFGPAPRRVHAHIAVTEWD
jgi:menaquinone-dependent protoporphyrinogen oxidase